ncbi:SagB/ThcOx family dehydrogenase [Planomonospora algeriensis]
MSLAGAEETPWPTGFRIRPAVDAEAADVEVTDTVTGRRFRWSPESLSEYILAGGRTTGDLTGNRDGWLEALDRSQERDRLLPGWRHWQRRGWYPSDQYYVASRRWAYDDTTDRDGAIREATVAEYLRKDGPPPEPVRLSGPRVALGEPASPGAQPVSRLLATRRSGRAYVNEPVALGRLSGLLWYGLAEVRKRAARTDDSQPMSYLDSYGSAWDFHLCVYNVDGVEPGTYRYELLDHELTGIRPGDHRETMIDVLQGMHSPATAAWTLGMVADFPRYQWRYRHEHGLRRLYLEAGILGQELLILGMSYGLSTLVTPAQKDRAYLGLHGLEDRRHAPVYTLTMGLSRGGAGIDFHGESAWERDVDAP